MFGGLSDPYTIGYVDADKDTQMRTNLVKNDLNPKWDEYLVFGADHLPRMLSIIVMDHDDVGKDDVIGKCEIALDHLCNIENLGSCTNKKLLCSVL